MNDVIVRKKRGIHDKSRKRVLLVITTDSDVTVKDLTDCFPAECDGVVVLVLHTLLKGNDLERKVRAYMRDNDISEKKGDKVLFLVGKRRGGGNIDCS